MIRVVAVDDEPLALAVIRKYCEDAAMVDLVATFTDALKALKYLESETVDLLFLDIRMPDIDGFRLLEKLSSPPLVIFTTAYAEHAVKGFEIAALDYLVKPVRFERFMMAIQRAVRWINAPERQPAEPESGILMVRSGYSQVRIKLESVLYIEGFDDYIRIHLADGQPPVVSLMSLKNILEKLPAGRFCRVHRSFIVPVDRVTHIRNKRLFLGQCPIPIGDAYAKTVKKLILPRGI